MQRGKFAAANLLAVILPKKDTFDVEFLQMCLNAQKDKIAKTKMSGATNVTMRYSDLYDIRVVMPTIVEQKQIVAQFNIEQQIIESNRRLIEIYEQKIAEILESI